MLAILSSNEKKDELKQVISTRKNRLSGKRAIIKGLHVVTTVEIHAEVEKAEKATAGRKRKRSPDVMSQQQLNTERIQKMKVMQNR
jgi:hypothetical protein